MGGRRLSTLRHSWSPRAGHVVYWTPQPFGPWMGFIQTIDFTNLRECPIARPRGAGGMITVWMRSGKEICKTWLDAVRSFCADIDPDADPSLSSPLEIHNYWTRPRDEDDRVDESHSDLRLAYLNDSPEQSNARSRC